MFAEEVAIVQFEARAAGVADGQQPAAAPQGAQRLGERGRADVVDDDIDAAPGRQPVHLAPPLCFGAVDDLVRPQGGRLGQLGRGGADDEDRSRANQPGDLDGRGVDPAAGADDEDGLAR